MLKFIRKLNWFERIYLVVGIIAVIVCFVLNPNKNWLSLFSSLVGIIGVFCVAKGFIVAPFICIIQSILYVILSFTQKYYGEMILGFIYIITSIVTIITWLRNRNKADKDFVQVNKIKGLEYFLVIPVSVVVGVGCYYMLKALGTNEVLTSTFSMVASLVASYLVIRRSAYYAVGYVLNDVIVVILWILTIKNAGIEFLPTIIAYILYFVNDIYALVNWKMMAKKQNKQKENTEQKSQEDIENINAM